MKIAITGAAGFIGSNLAKKLEFRDNLDELILIDNLSRGKKRYLSYLGIKSGLFCEDSKNFRRMKELFRGVNVVYHIAARVGGMQHLHGSRINELKTIQENLVIDATVLKACLECDVPKVIFTSSISVYPTQHQMMKKAVIFKEDNIRPLDPEGGYGWAKFLAEEQLKWMSNKYAIARIFGTYGPCMDDSRNRSSDTCLDQECS